jgi:ABC-type sulfate transport system permease subunit
LLFGVLPAWYISTNNFIGKNIYDILLYLPLSNSSIYHGIYL